MAASQGKALQTVHLSLGVVDSVGYLFNYTGAAVHHVCTKTIDTGWPLQGGNGIWAGFGLQSRRLNVE